MSRLYRAWLTLAIWGVNFACKRCMGSTSTCRSFFLISMFVPNVCSLSFTISPCDCITVKPSLPQWEWAGSEQWCEQLLCYPETAEEQSFSSFTAVHFHLTLPPVGAMASGYQRLASTASKVAMFFHDPALMSVGIEHPLTISLALPSQHQVAKFWNKDATVRASGAWGNPSLKFCHPIQKKR